MAIGRIPEPGTGIPESIIAAKGDILTGTANDTPAVLTAGTNETRLVADSAQATGLKYVADTTNYAVAAKGDLLVGTAADTLAALAVGTNGHTLVADSTETTGLKWVAPAGGGGITLIQDTVASANTAIDFNSISGSYKHLFLTWHGLHTNIDGSFFAVRLNADSGSNYVRQYFYYEEDSPFTSPSFTVADNTSTDLEAFVNQGKNTTVSKTAFGYINIYNYASTTRTKKFEADYFYWSDNNSRVNRLTQQGYYNSTTAITSVNIFRGNGTATLSNLSNSSIQLWGVS
jgi:hypothetical protein